jgi:hypothetical protein
MISERTRLTPHQGKVGLALGAVLLMVCFAIGLAGVLVPSNALGHFLGTLGLVTFMGGTIALWFVFLRWRGRGPKP